MPSYCTNTRANAARRALARYCPRAFNCNRRPFAPLKLSELLFQLPLQPRLITPVEKILAGRTRCRRRSQARALLHWNKRLAVAPETGALEEGVLQTGARHALQLA